MHTRLWLSWLELFPEYGEVWLMRGQTQHDQVCVSSIETVMSVGVMVGLTLLMTNEVHDLVFTLTWDAGIRQNHLGEAILHVA